jgi:type IV secretory pathway VirB9-like protein
MVAENQGSIPPNTSLMVITAGSKRYEVFISSTEQKNAKIILDLSQ